MIIKSNSFQIGVISGSIISISLLGLGVKPLGLIITSAIALFAASSATLVSIFQPEIPFRRGGARSMAFIRAFLGISVSSVVFAFVGKVAIKISSSFALSIQAGSLIAAIIIIVYALFGIWSLSLVMKFSRSGMNSRKNL